MAIKRGAVPIVLGLIVLYVVIFLVSKYIFTRDTFTTEEKPLKKGDNIPVDNTAADPFAKPYATTSIMGVDDYEIDVVNNNLGDKQISDAQINARTGSYPYDWAQLPPNSQTFQDKQAQWMQNKSQLLPDLDQYASIEGFSVFPTDSDKTEAEEQKLLKTYVPACSKGLKYDLDDAMGLIHKIYDQKGLVPSVDVREDGVYEVYETMEKNPKIVWEDEVDETPRQTYKESLETKFEVPQYASDQAAGLDPFFEPTQRLRADRNDYTQWTPGLERMFAPTQPRAAWY
jgi:hypothetical protein